MCLFFDFFLFLFVLIFRGMLIVSPKCISLPFNKKLHHFTGSLFPLTLNEKFLTIETLKYFGTHVFKASSVAVRLANQLQVLVLKMKKKQKSISLNDVISFCLEVSRDIRIIGFLSSAMTGPRSGSSWFSYDTISKLCSQPPHNKRLRHVTSMTNVTNKFRDKRQRKSSKLGKKTKHIKHILFHACQIYLRTSAGGKKTTQHPRQLCYFPLQRSASQCHRRAAPSINDRRAALPEFMWSDS